MAQKPNYVHTDNLAKVMASISKLTAQEVLVGIQENSARVGGGPTNAELGYWLEFGVPSQNIPARPFMEDGIDAAKDRINKQLEKGVKALLDGDHDGANKALNAAGMIAVASIKNTITDGDFAPLAESTIAARKRAGNDSEKPLTVTGQLRNSIDYVVVAKGDK